MTLIREVYVEKIVRLGPNVRPSSYRHQTCIRDESLYHDCRFLGYLERVTLDQAFPADTDRFQLATRVAGYWVLYTPAEGPCP